jgi:tetratricopeptide (TPR) repeat protein
MKTNQLSLQLAYGSIFFLLLLGTAWLYWSGLHSIFMLDDEVNLEPLANITDTDILTGIAQVVTEGTAGQMGRPLSLLTFALQFHSWPLNVWDFKYVNLMIHLLNGCLVFWFILLLGRVLALSTARSLLLALLTATVWLLHPLQVSTVLYVVQRMTQLATLFTLVGLIAYLQGRQYLSQSQLLKGFVWVSLGIGLGGTLATLSKENGVLLVLYVLVLETTLLRSLPKPPYWRPWFALFIYAPLALLCLYFASQFGNFLQAYEIRDFTMGERLLTEARVLSDYVTKILLLQPQSFNLFSDDYTVSHNLWTPLTTLPAVVMVILLFLAALWQRRTLPILSFAILWFLAGHLLESSFIGLVLYFEHRNYLPMLGIVFAVLYGAILLFEHMPTAYLRKAAIAFSLLWLLLFPLITWLQTTLWADPVRQAIFWADKKPFSRFAQSHAASLLVKLEQYATATQYYQRMTQAFPEDTGPYILWLSLSCKAHITLPDKSHLLHQLQTGNLDTATITGLDFILIEKAKGRCDLESNTLEELFDTLIHNPHTTTYLTHLYRLYAIFQAQEQHYIQAVQSAEQSLTLMDQPQLRLKQVEWLIAANHLEEAQTYLHKTRTTLNPLTALLYAKWMGLLELKIKILQEIQQNMKSSSPPLRP